MHLREQAVLRSHIGLSRDVDRGSNAMSLRPLHRIIAAAERMRAGWRAAKPGRRFAEQGRGERLAHRGRIPSFERDAFAPAIALGGASGCKPKLHLRKRVAAPGPAGERIGFGAPSRSKTQPPPARMGTARLVDADGQRLDNRPGAGWQCAHATRGWRSIIVGQHRWHLFCHGRREARPGTEVPDLPVKRPAH